MSYRGRRQGTLENDIEKAREEGAWRRVTELAGQLRERPDTSRQYETLGLFLIGEGKLEEYLEEFPAKEKNVAEARVRLREAKDCLEKTIGEEAKRLGVHLDSWILLAKLNFAMGHYSESLKYYEKAQIESLEEKQLPARSLKIMAEAFAIKGLCYEKLALNTTSKHKLLERETKISRCYELAGDLTLLYLQEADRAARRGHTQSTLSLASVGTAPASSSPVPPATEHKLGHILEAALLQAPLANLRAGRVDRAISRFRCVLQAEECRSTGGLRLGVTRQLAELLLNSVSDRSYRPPDNQDSPKRGGARTALQGPDSPWKPRKYTGPGLWVPATRQEEAVLLLLLAEAMASKHVPLNQTPEYDTHRAATMGKAVTVFNLTTLTCGRAGQHKLLVDMFERSLRFSPKEDHVWSQFSLALAAAGRTPRALVVLQEVAVQRPQDSSVCMLAARLCYERLDLLAAGVGWASKALAAEQKSGGELVARAHLYLGLGLSLQSQGEETRGRASDLAARALEQLQLAVQADPGDHLAYFHLGLHLAGQRRTGEAELAVRASLQLQPDHCPSLQLAALLLTARGQVGEALVLVLEALTEWPDQLGLLGVRARLEEEVEGGQAALQTARTMLSLLRELGEAGGQAGLSATDSGVELQDSRSVVAPPHWDAASDRDSVSLQAHSVAASQVERTLSEVASSLSAGPPRSGPHDAAYTQIRTWLLTGELYLRLGQLEAAELCANEARQVYPLSYLILYLKGKIHAAREEWELAKTCYQNSLSIYPRHLASLQELGLLHLRLGSPRLAEQTLRAALRLEPHSHTSWYNLGLVMETMSCETETAADCFATAQAMQETSPILPYNTVPIAFE